MISVLSRYLLRPRKFLNVRCSIKSLTLFNSKAKYEQTSAQMDYILSVFETKNPDWDKVKENVLKYDGDTNKKNYDGMLLKMMKTRRKLDLALTFVEYLKSSNEELTLGSINGILSLYHELSFVRPLNDNERSFILESGENLYNKYKVLDSVTCEKLIHAFCAINEWEKALKMLEDVYISCTPSHSTYSTIIATLFRNNKKADALRLIEISLINKRPLIDIAYEEWVNYYLRKYKKKDTIVKNIETIFENISKHCAVISDVTADMFKETLTNLDWNVTYTKIRKSNGECVYCKTKLASLDLDKKEFGQLQQIIKEKIIVGSDLFLKTSPEELKRFQKFIDETAPYDVVFDALNISYTGRTVQNAQQRLATLKEAVDYFSEKNKKILVLGRRHMLRGNNKLIQNIMSRTCSFFTDDMSQDDPYLITAAIMSGPHTDIVSKDLFRGHRILLKDQKLRLLFQKWQWQHQWMLVYSHKIKGLQFLAPLQFTPCAQKTGKGWHLPFARPDAKTFGNIHDNIPDLSTWLCIQPRMKR